MSKWRNSIRGLTPGLSGSPRQRRAGQHAALSLAKKWVTGPWLAETNRWMFPLASRAWRVEASTGGAGSQETPDTDKYPTPHPPHPRRVHSSSALCSAATRTHAADTRHAAPARRVSSTPMLCGAHVPVLARARRRTREFHQILWDHKRNKLHKLEQRLHDENNENNEMVLFKLYWMWTIISQAARHSRPEKWSEVWIGNVSCSNKTLSCFKTTIFSNVISLFLYIVDYQLLSMSM